jgi:uncharacterized protein
MVPLVQNSLGQIQELCRKYHVRKLELFGSATNGNFNAESDVDFLVDFEPLKPGTRANTYFGLWEDLKALLAREVDLLETSAVDNPYFLAEINPTREVLFGQ